MFCPQKSSKTLQETSIGVEEVVLLCQGDVYLITQGSYFLSGARMRYLCRTIAR